MNRKSILFVNGFYNNFCNHLHFKFNFFKMKVNVKAWQFICFMTIKRKSRFDKTARNSLEITKIKRHNFFKRNQVLIVSALCSLMKTILSLKPNTAASHDA